VQTFLPYADFRKSAAVLDYRRLGKQRVETWQILNVLLQLKANPDAKPAWMNHPAVLMWQGYEPALCLYGIDMCREWMARGYNDTMYDRFAKTYAGLWQNFYLPPNPPWIGRISFHQSHRSNLLRKDWRYYRKYWPKLSSKLEYVWPVTKDMKSDAKKNQNHLTMVSS